MPTRAATTISLTIAAAGASLSALAHADSLGITPAVAGDGDRGGALRDLPAAVAYATGAAAIVMLLTFARRLPARARPARGPTAIEVRPPSATGEAGLVARAALAVALAAFTVIAVRSAPPRARDDLAKHATAAASAVALRDVEASLQARYRELATGIAAAERMRDSGGAWPAVARLAAAGIAPFATSAAADAPYRWTLYDEGGIASYVGTPAGRATDPPLLASIADGAAHPDAVGVMHAPPGDTPFRVSIWFRPAGIAAALPTKAVSDPAGQRWMQIVTSDGDR